MIQQLTADVNLNPEAIREIYRQEDACGYGKRFGLRLYHNL